MREHSGGPLYRRMGAPSPAGWFGSYESERVSHSTIIPAH